MWWDARRLHMQTRQGRLAQVGAAALGLSLTISLAAPGEAVTQSASAAACEIPVAASALPPAADATPGSSPVSAADVIQIEGGSDDAATPASLPLATPIAPETTPPAPDPEVQLRSELRAVADALAACLSAGDAEMVTRLAGEQFLGQLYGSSVPFSREDYLAIASELTPIPTRIVAVADVEQTSENRATAAVTQVVGNQLLRAEWTFTQATGRDRADDETAWLVATERRLPVEAPRGASLINVEIGARSFTLNEQTVDGPDVILRGANTATVDHEMLVLRYENGFTSTDLLRSAGPNFPDEVTFIGEVAVRAEDTAELVLVDLEPGAYTIVCLFSNEDGLPYLVDGMEATFTVEE